LSKDREYRPPCGGNPAAIGTWKNMMVNLKTTRTVYLIILMMGIPGIFNPGIFRARPAAAFEFTLQAAGGYDDNVTLTDDASGSGFGLYRLGLSRRIYKSGDGLTSRLYLDGTYQDYSRFSDNYAIRAGGATDWYFLDLLRPGVYYEAMFYRDREFKYDDLNEFLLGGRLEWLAAAAWTIDADQSFAFQDGKIQGLDIVTDGDTFQPGRGHHGMGGGAGGGRGGAGTGGSGMTGAGGATGMGTSASGDGFLSRSSAGITAHPAASLDAGVRLMLNRRWASGDGDAYWEHGLSLFSFWRPEIPRFGDRFQMRPRLRMVLEYRKADYLDGSVDPDRDDAIWFAALGLVLPIDPLELYAEGRWVDVDSSSAEESYRKGVIQCGLSWYF
jgi:hypothetical protein